jgi:DNA-binding FrmR family transcriptional regulator
MSHTVREQKKLLNRVRRLRGQLEAVEKALTEERECSAVLHMLAAARGAINGLMAELVEGHIRCHVLEEGLGVDHPRAVAAQELVDVVHSYLK